MLEEQIRQTILAYPTLYRGKSYAASRYSVLNHMFFVIGNGYEWDKTGRFLQNDSLPKVSLIELPDDFFKLNLFVCRIKDAELPEELKNRFHYFIDKNTRTDVVYEAKSQKEADAVAQKLSQDSFRQQREMQFGENADNRFPYDPYPLSQFSALVEMTNGKTAEGNQLYPDPEYVAGAIDIANEALKFYEDKKRLCAPNTHGLTFKKARALWKKQKKEQIALINAFLEKYAPVHA